MEVFVKPKRTTSSKLALLCQTDEYIKVNNISTANGEFITIIDGSTSFDAIKSNEDLLAALLGNLCRIKVSPKIWRPEMVSKYIIPDYTDHNMDAVLNYGKYGRCIYRSNVKWDSGVKRMDIILFEESKHCSELDNDLNFILPLAAIAKRLSRT